MDCNFQPLFEVNMQIFSITKMSERKYRVGPKVILIACLLAIYLDCIYDLIEDSRKCPIYNPKLGPDGVHLLCTPAEDQPMRRFRRSIRNVVILHSKVLSHNVTKKESQERLSGNGRITTTNTTN